MVNPFFPKRNYGYYQNYNYPFFPYGYRTYRKDIKEDSKEDMDKNKASSQESYWTNNKKANDFETKRSQSSASSNDDRPVFEIFGIKLYFDDILLISLIFFLYNEGVKDESLFIALILLLLS